MRTFIALAAVSIIFCLSGCGEAKKKASSAVNSVEDAAAAKAKRIENFAKDRINLDTQSP